MSELTFEEAVERLEALKGRRVGVTVQPVVTSRADLWTQAGGYIGGVLRQVKEPVARPGRRTLDIGSAGAVWFDDTATFEPLLNDEEGVRAVTSHLAIQIKSEPEPPAYLRG